MPNLNYAEVWNPELLEIRIQETLSSPFITQNVRWLDAKTFHFTQMSTSGYKSHNRNGGWNTGKYVQTDVPFTLTHDRDVEFLVDKADVDETNSTASIKNISEVFEKHSLLPKLTLFSSQRQPQRHRHLRAITLQQPPHHTQRATCLISSKAFFQQAS